MGEEAVTLNMGAPEESQHSTGGRHFWNTDGEVIAELLQMAKDPKSEQCGKFLRMIQHARMMAMIYGADEKAPENN